MMTKYIKHERPCFTTFPNTENAVENMKPSRLFFYQLRVPKDNTEK